MLGAEKNVKGKGLGLRIGLEPRIGKYYGG